MIFTASAGFVKESGLGYDEKGLNRINHRYGALIEPIANEIRDKRVLDIASHDGRWTYACLVNGARHVTGVEVRPELIKKSNYILNPEMRRRARFMAGDLFDLLPKLLQSKEQFDVVLCLGIFYHVMDHYRLMKLMTEFSPKVIVMDTGLLDSDEPMIQLATESSQSFLNGAALPNSKVVPIGIMSRGGIEMMANAFHYSIYYHPWSRKSVSDPRGLGDYLVTNKLGRRRYSFFLRPAA